MPEIDTLRQSCRLIVMIHAGDNLSLAKPVPLQDSAYFLRYLVRKVRYVKRPFTVKPEGNSS